MWTKDIVSEFIKTLNSQDWELLGARYMAENLVVETPGDGTLVGRRNFLDLFFVPMHSGVEEYFRDIHAMVIDDPWLLLDITVEYRCVRDHPGFPIQPLTVGNTLWAQYFFLYRIEDDMIASLKAVRYGTRLAKTEH
ncbi:nuclear transport factor 2 family protein [Nocardia jiangxiensis]|uniref:Nuclear transport factor 2 family protein n=1 Tax=Nocardia jiangxiensis TaxID=282685 RepID=A0ABW6S3S1_9NOCA